LYSNTTGGNNVAIGRSALETNTTASNNTAVGYQAAFTQSDANAAGVTAIGYQAGYNNDTGPQLFVGREAGYSTTTGESNTAVGAYRPLYSNTTGAYNVAIGRQALYSNTTANNNTAVGYQAGYSNTTAVQSVYLGAQAGYTSTSAQNTFLGYYCGRNNTTGHANTFIGESSGNLVSSGAKNTILGRYDGNQGGLNIRTSSNNIVLSDGDGNPRGRFDSSGNWYVNKFTTDFNTAGARMRVDGAIEAVRDGNDPLFVHRLTNDGGLVIFYAQGSVEGSISVSGTTVSYNGGHLARWSQTAENTRIDLLKGTVMTNLDQMAVWGDEDNEQLNCMAVSSVEGDPNVAGVFVNWDDGDETYTADMNVAMTGDMIIRIAQGTTVQRGDLLMSAGDGTAKPQGDDIVRSKTIAKVTSTHVTCTYDDGSYCVPCVLMAC
jgi:hypothetical protein